MTEQLLTPSKITAWLDCPHYLTLKNRVHEGRLDQPASRFGSFAQLIMAKGLEHERACLDEYERLGRRIHTVPDRPPGLLFAEWAAQIGDPLAGDGEVIYQLPFAHDGIRGIADFVVRVADPDTGVVSWEPVDAKLTRAEAKPGHVLQLCFYAEAIEAATGVAPRHMHIWLGSGRCETLEVAQFRPYWNRIKAQLAAVVDRDPEAADTTPELCPHCAYCEFFDTCTAQWRADDALLYVANIRPSERRALVQAGVPTLAGLATLGDHDGQPVDGIQADRLVRLVDQATLQAAARLIDPTDHPPFELIEPGDDPTWGHGFDLLPEPDTGDLFLDFEGHPFWRPDTGLFFLFGWIERDATGAWTYRAEWAHDLDEEAATAARVIEHLAERRRQHPGMHVYHYNHTERSSLERLAAVHGVHEALLAHLVDTGLFVDLLVVARNALQAGTESYSLKELERLTAFERGHEIDAGAGAVLEYERWQADHDPAALDRIAAYNEDDVRATGALRAWLVEHRPTDLAWRAAVLASTDDLPDLDEQVERLHAFDPESPEHLLGDVLGYWRREWQAHLAPLLVRCQADNTELLLGDPEIVAGLTHTGTVDRLGAKDKVLGQAHRYVFPPQILEAFRGTDQVLFPGPDGRVVYGKLCGLDRAAGHLDFQADKDAEPEPHPTVLARNDWVRPKPKPDALNELASRTLDPSGGMANPSHRALLARDRPRFVAGGGPPSGRFTDELDEMVAWATQLDGSSVSVQGPPGTGKTYRGAHLIRTLLLAGKRVGITAFSHHAIANLVEETVKVFREEGGLEHLHGIRKPPAGFTGAAPDGFELTTNNKTCAKDDYNLVAGTTWLFAGKDMAAASVDVLIIDEAGQLALADALAAARSARNLVLLGDPLQLPQVSKAVHPNGSGASALQHVLGDQATMPDDRGVFLTETRRMHPDVCRFISEELYDGRLHSHPSCAGQTTAAGTGLRWLPADHTGCATESRDEADLVAEQIQQLMGTDWTNQRGQSAPLGPEDFMVVAPYNDQVHLLRDVLDADPVTRGVPVGTVDRFQGRQAAVVFFTMTTSTAADMVRGGDFLFSRERLNVAVSRARCLAYLVCTEALLDSRGRNVEDMRRLSTLCSFVEHALPD